MVMPMHGAGGATLHTLNVWQYLPLSRLIPSWHHDWKSAEVTMQNPPFCCILVWQNVEDCQFAVMILSVQTLKIQCRPTVSETNFQTYRYIYKHNVLWTSNINFSCNDARHARSTVTDRLDPWMSPRTTWLPQWPLTSREGMVCREVPA